MADRLLARFEELEDAAMARVNAIAGIDRSMDPTYLSGLRLAVAEALKYGIAAIARGDGRAPPIPSILTSQARVAAHHRIELDVVVRRYTAGYALLGDFATEEAIRSRLLDAGETQRLARAQTALFDHLISTVVEEYQREAKGRQRSVDERRTELLRGLLNGELVDTSEFHYDFNGWHLGAVASGPKATEALRRIARKAGHRVLLARGDDGNVWAWLGGARPMSSAELDRTAVGLWPTSALLAIGEPAEGMLGWRLTHRQACAVLPLAPDQARNVVRYSADALYASLRQDDLLVKSLRQIYLEPLARESDGGEILRRTLKAYFAVGGNVSSTAAKLQINRKTVSKRLALVEQLIGRSLRDCGAELEVALRVYDSRDQLIALHRSQSG